MDFAKHLEKYLSKEDIAKLVSSFDEKEHKGVYLNTKKMSEETFMDLFPTILDTALTTVSDTTTCEWSCHTEVIHIAT